MLITIVTVCLNAKSTIGRCLESVGTQCDHRLCEHIIVDGGSSDGTLDLIIDYARLHHNVRFVSEKDQGISDAFNKGIKMANGRFIGFLNADDWYIQGSLAILFQAAKKMPHDILIFDAIYHWHNATRYVYSNPRMLTWEMTVTHPATFVRRTSFGRVGLFNLKYKYAMDFDILLRLLKARSRIAYLQRPIVNMAMGGVSDKNWEKALWECYFSLRRHREPLILAYLYYISKIVRGRITRLTGPPWLLRLIWTFKRKLSINNAIDVCLL